MWCVVTGTEPVRDTDLRVGCGVIQSSLQSVAQTFREILFQDQVQAVPTQLNGQNCVGGAGCKEKKNEGQ